MVSTPRCAVTSGDGSLLFPVGASPLVHDSCLPSAPAPPPPSSPGLPSLSSANAKAAAQDLLGLCLQSTTQVCIQTHFCSHPPGSSCLGVISELIVPWPMCPKLQSAHFFCVCLSGLFPPSSSQNLCSCSSYIPRPQDPRPLCVSAADRSLLPPG